MCFLFLGEREIKCRSGIFHSNSNCVSIADVPAVTIDGDSKQFIARGHEMQLTCRYDASPPVSNVRWELNGTVIAINASVNISDSRIAIPHYNESLIQLTVNPTTSQDAGNYTCNVTNDMGHSSATTVIVIEGVFHFTELIIERAHALHSCLSLKVFMLYVFIIRNY